MAILLEEEGLLRPRAHLRDGHQRRRCCSRRAAGIFPLDRMQEYTENYIRAGGTRSFSEYYTAKYDGALFSPSLTRNVVFSQHNLVTDRSFSEFNVIFCRNVLIYFDRDAAEPRALAVLRQPGHVRHPRAGQQGVAAVLAVRAVLREAAIRARSSTGRSGEPCAVRDRSWSGRRGAGWPRCATLVAGLPATFAAADRRRAASPQGRRITCCARCCRSARRSSVCEVEDKTPIAAGHVYVAPPDYHLLVEPGHFSLSTDAPVRYSRPSIDVTFASAADAYGDRDGRRRAHRRERGRRARAASASPTAAGCAIVQDPDDRREPDDAGGGAARACRARACCRSPRSRRISATLPARRRRAGGRRARRDAALAVDATDVSAPTRAERGRDPARRRPAGEPARARGDPRAARPDARPRALGRRGAAHAARSTTSRSSCSTCRCRASTASRRRS